MGNYSRNTYDQAKGYVSVRLQQGVPLVDADWNEAADDMRNEFYAAMQTVLPDGAQNPSVLRIGPWISPTNDLNIQPGSFPAGGRLATLLSTTFFHGPQTVYSEQRWTDAAAAAHDGVPVIPPLTTPTAARTDTVYADIWEQEINSGDDPNLINPAIGMETCVRLKRNVAIRVAEGATTAPAAPVGHTYMTIAQLNRAAGDATITGNMITDLRPLYAMAYGYKSITMHPDLRPYGAAPAWSLAIQYAYSPSGSTYAAGIIVLPLPDRARAVSVGVSGAFGGAGGSSIYVYLYQVDISGNSVLLAGPTYTATAAGNFYLSAIPSTTYVVDRTQFAYVLYVYASSTSQTIIHPIQLNYTL